MSERLGSKSSCSVTRNPKNTGSITSQFHEHSSINNQNPGFSGSQRESAEQKGKKNHRKRSQCLASPLTWHLPLAWHRSRVHKFLGWPLREGAHFWRVSLGAANAQMLTQANLIHPQHRPHIQPLPELCAFQTRSLGNGSQTVPFTRHGCLLLFAHIRKKTLSEVGPSLSDKMKTSKNIGK